MSDILTRHDNGDHADCERWECSHWRGRPVLSVPVWLSAEAAYGYESGWDAAMQEVGYEDV